MENGRLGNNDYELETKWNTIKETFVKEYSCLTQKDLDYSKGEFNKMLDHIGKKIGITESKLRRIIVQWDDSWLHFF